MDEQLHDKVSKLMIEHKKAPVWAILLNVLISMLLVCGGIYALVEKKMIISGKYSGNLYMLRESESVAIAISMFLVAAFLILFLFDNKLIKNVAMGLLGLGIFLFIFSSFM